MLISHLELNTFYPAFYQTHAHACHINLHVLHLLSQLHYAGTNDSMTLNLAFLVFRVFVNRVIKNRRRQELKGLHQNGETTMKLLMNSGRDYDTLPLNNISQLNQMNQMNQLNQINQMATINRMDTYATLQQPQHPSDPVELRRLNHQTAAMASHPPIAVADLANHIDVCNFNFFLSVILTLYFLIASQNG